MSDASGGTVRAAEGFRRIQLRFSRDTMKRLGVHCAVAGEDQSRETERILLEFLTREGLGRELFTDEVGPDAE